MRAFLFFILLVIFSSGCSLSSNTKAEPVDSVKKKVVVYLIADGYNKGEFNVEVEYHKTGKGKYGGPYSIQVKFDDEPNVIYDYSYNSKTKDISQIGVTPLKGKNNKEFKHAE